MPDSTPPHATKSPALWAVSAAVLAAIAAAVVYWYVEQPRFKHPWDYAQYWSSGRANAVGKNPYDPNVLRPYQWSSPRRGDGDPVMMWNPPHALAAYMPLGALPPGLAWKLWFVLQLGAVLVSARWLWRVYGGPPDRWWVPYLVAVGSVGLPHLLDYGQNAGLILLGLAGFVYYTHRGAPLRAGLFVALTALKPNILLPFGVVLILHGTTRAGRKPLLMGAGVVLAGLAAAVAFNPSVVSQFREALGKPPERALTPVSYWQLPLAAYHLRDWAATSFVPPEQLRPDSLFWVQFVPVGVGCLAAAGYWFVRRRTWDWSVETPRLVWLSLLSAPYGGWLFDLTLLILPAVQAAAWVTNSGRPLVAAVVTTLYALLTLATLKWRPLHDFTLVTPALFGCYLLAGWVGRPTDPLPAKDRP